MDAAFLGQSLTTPRHQVAIIRSTCPAKRPRIAQCSMPNDDDDERNGQPGAETELSRRVFMGGIAVTTAATALVGYRIVIGEDIEARVYARIKRRFPQFFPRESTPDERRRPLKLSFAQAYFDAVETVAVQMGIITRELLHSEEALVRQRAFSLFFQDVSPQKSLANTAWLNFVLYSRLHVVAQRTSPKSRLQFVDRLSRFTAANLRTRFVKQSGEVSRADASTWLARIDELLKELVEIGWISGYRVEDFDAEPGSVWQDEGRGSLTIYALDPATIQAAQLIGEEEYEELSPKISGWIRVLLLDSGISVTLEDYYLDDQYRPDPDQFRPSQLATQLDLVL